MTRIGKLGQELVDRIKNKINSKAISARGTQRTFETLTSQQETQDTFEKITSNGVLLDVGYELHEESQDACEEFMDEYAYSQLYEQEHTPYIPQKVLNIIA